MAVKLVLRHYIFACFCFTTLLRPGHAITVLPNGGLDSSSCCLSFASPCETLEYAFSCIANGTSGSPAEIFIDGVASINRTINFTIPTGYNVSVKSRTEANAEIKCTSSRAVLELRSNGVSDISFKGILIHNCGPEVPAAILIEGPLNARFDHCTFENNTCSGLNVRDANVLIKNSKFRNNIANASNSFEIDFEFGKTSLGGSLGIMFDKGVGNQVEIISSNFSHSKSFVNRGRYAVSHDTGKQRLLSNYYASGGGLSVINTFDSKENTVIIKECNFEHNRGTYGGGLFLTFVHNATGSRVLLENSIVANNFVSLTGGGLLISSWDRAYNNSVDIKNCHIFSNNAMGGGAMKVIYNSIDPYSESKVGSLNFKMQNTNIYGNRATSGSALRLLSNAPAGRIQPILPKIVDCVIKGHRPARGSKEYPGAVLSTKLGIEFIGTNYLLDNVQGSAIYISSGTIHVKGTLIFHGNIGAQGGAAYLADTSRIKMYPGSYLNISKNHANFRGGGLYVEATTLQDVIYPYNPGCFLQYSEAKIPPSKWQAQVVFTNNSASLKGAALFLNSLVGCLWGENKYDSLKNNTLRWADKISYTGNFILLEGKNVMIEGADADIATDTYDFTVQNTEQPFQVAPGEIFAINITAIDQLGHNIHSVPVVKQILTSSSGREETIGQQYFVLPPGEKTPPQLSLTMPSLDIYSLTAGGNDSEVIRISATQSNFLVEKNLRLETQKCHPGYIFDGKTCVCDLSIPGLERCSKGRYLYLKEGYWGGIINGAFVTNICPRGYCKCSKEPGATGCFYDYKKPDNFCTEGRDDILCGRCKDGLALSLRPTKCINCDGTGLVLALSMTGVLIFTLLIIYFNPNIPTDLRGILFYVQVLQFLFKPNDEVGDIVTFISGVTDLGRPTEYPFETCAVPGLGNLGTTTLNYVTPLEVIVILAVIYLIRPFIRFHKSKPFQCFLVLIVLMYKYLVETSFAIIHCVDVGEKTVFFYDGSWECNKGFHAGFFTLSVIVIIIFVFLPIIVLFVVVHRGSGRRYLCFKVELAVIDALTQGLRRHTDEFPCENCKKSLRSQSEPGTDVEAESCSPCSKKVEKSCDQCARRAENFWSEYIGKERGWWWSVDFARRVVLVALYVFIQDWQLKQVCLTVACSFIFALHCIAWPYNEKKRWANEIEAVYLFALMVLANVQSIEHKNTRHTASIAILLISYSFGGIFFLVKAFKFIIKKRKG